ncbi:PQQ-binding-like beta-propeller repeat protein [Flavobacterium sp. GP15]|uniref:outer membrane protein assembly factor BamB family protein n=1 Tax=Flavobacterium sp. GP15 TaxID=2758567 RepID=UPI00165D5B18|nr:PQQ-binding-like beta-propeller repeat protein [Flavobacterium sp. GP15]
MKYLYSKILFLFIITSCLSQKIDKKQDIKFVHLTDIHVTEGNDNDFLLQKIIKEINESTNEFVIITGDLTNRGDDDELNRVHTILSGLKIPYHIISGNHETTWSESAALTYKKLWGADRFAFSKGDYLFIGFPCGPYMKMGDGFVKKEDLLFLDKTIKDSLINSSKKVLSFSHYPLDNSLSNYKEVLTVLKKYPTVANFCGHAHTLKEYNFSGLSGVMGASITSRDGKTQSYNEVIVSNDSIRIFKKELEKPATFKFSVSAKPSKIEITEPEEKQSIAPFIQDLASIYSVPSFDKKNFYFANSLGQIQSVNLKSKTLNWKIQTANSIYFTPTIVKKTIVVGTIEGQILGFDKDTAKEKWNIAVGGILVGTPIVENNRIYTASATQFICVDAVTGRMIWESKLPLSYSQGKPLIHENTIIFGSWDTFLYCLNKNTGALLWKWNNGNEKQELYSPGNVNVVASKNRLYFVTPERFLTILDINSGKTLLRTNQWKVRESMGKSEDGTLFYAKTMDGELLQLPLNDNLELTEDNLKKESKILDLKIGYEHNPAGILEKNGKIYLGSRKGEVIIVDAKKMMIIKTIKLGSSSINGFSIDESGSVWTALIEGGIYKID